MSVSTDDYESMKQLTYMSDKADVNFTTMQLFNVKGVMFMDEHAHRNFRVLENSILSDLIIELKDNRRLSKILSTNFESMEAWPMIQKAKFKKDNILIEEEDVHECMNIFLLKGEYYNIQEIIPFGGADFATGPTPFSFNSENNYYNEISNCLPDDLIFGGCIHCGSKNDPIIIHMYDTTGLCFIHLLYFEFDECDFTMINNITDIN